MVIDMNDSQLTTLIQIRGFLDGTTDVGFRPASEDAGRYRFIAGVLARFGYRRLGRTDKGLIRRYLMRVTGYSRALRAPGRNLKWRISTTCARSPCISRCAGTGPRLAPRQ